MLKVYNTLTRKKQEFVPQEPGKVGMYVCGVTPYNHPHIGNARPFVTWDVIKRYFRKKGFEVKHIQNFTDMDDKIIKAANTEGVDCSVISERYIKSYFEAMDKLNVQRADLYPKVTEHISDIIAMVQKLIDNGYAYELEGDVYFSVEKFPEYGKLSGRKLEDMQAGARVEVDQRKANPMDFALWKSAKPGEPFWESPWGKGRPGWHIECSTMSLKYLGETFDFHGGGSDLIFPHHENEIAQSQCCCGNYHSFIIISKKLGFYCLILFRCLADHHQLHVLWHHGKCGHFPFCIFLIVFLRVCQGNQMPQRPGNDVVFSFQDLIALLGTMKHPCNISSHGRFFCDNQ